MEQATELEWLRFFFTEADFGPAHEDVMMIIEEAFQEQTGKLVPQDYSMMEDK